MIVRILYNKISIAGNGCQGIKHELGEQKGIKYLFLKKVHRYKILHHWLNGLKCTQ